MREEKDKNITYTISWSQRMMSSPCSIWADPEEQSLEKDIDAGRLAEANEVINRIRAMK